MKSALTAGLLAALSVAACGSENAREAPAAAAAATETAASTPTQGPVQPEIRQFREWHAVCDNGNRCAAYTGSDQGGWLMVRMDAGGEARPEILAGLSALSGEDAVEGLRLGIDGQARTLGSGNRETGSPLAAGEVRGALADLAAARDLSLSLGETRAALPTAGASAALLWIDERQGRLGTTTALIRRGDRPATAVPAAPPLPQVQAAPSVDQGSLAGAADPMEDGDTAGIPLPAAVEALERVKACRAETSYNAYLQKAIFAARLGEDVQLWGVPCFSGAYNAGYDLYLTDGQGGSPRLAEFPTWQAKAPAEGDIAGEGLVNPVYDARTNTLRHFPRGRGLGDCGTMQSWTWTGRAFVLNAERTMGECWGIAPDLWPTTWRTR